MSNETGTATYHVEDMRVTKPSAKVAEKNPDRALTVTGTFYAVVDGKVSAEAFTYPSKEITRKMALSPLFVLDQASGTLTVPAGERGRKESPGLSADDVSAFLSELRESISADDAEAIEAAAE